ncbi:MAG: hypothetical protein EOO03_14220 [Chitinophagaceae bacterium]|nr:MAG: hypothetical protein EOO03_14220 [Chitinophagaceae bacterium]
MYKNINAFTLLAIAAMWLLTGCKKEEFSFGEIKTPTNLTLTTTIAGMDAGNPNGNGTGVVAITANAEQALTYKIDYGDGTSAMVTSGSITKKYSSPGTNDYTITVTAVGTGGVTTTTTKVIRLFVAFEIPAPMLAALTGVAPITSKVWITDKNAPGHFGVGPADAFNSIWYAAPPNTREACAYDDEITFSRDALNRISMTIDNRGQSFSTGAATGFYGQSGGDGCYNISTGGTRLLSFMAATSGSTAAQSTRIQFVVPGNGIVNFGTGGVAYEILEFTATTMHIRNIGADGNSWYQKLIVKP